MANHSYSQLINSFKNESGDLNELKVTLKFPEMASTIVGGVTFFLAFLGVTGNFLTILALTKSKKLRVQATTWFVISLCVSDLILCAYNLPLTAVRFIYQKWIFSDIFCQLFPFIFYGNFGVSLFHIMLIAINRYLLVSGNQHYAKIYTPKMRIAQIIGIYLFSFSFLFPSLIGVWGQMGLNEETFSCTILKKDGKSPKKFMYLFGILLPFVVICFCYAAIIRCVHQSKVALKKSSVNNPGLSTTFSNLRKSEIKMTKTMLLIFGCFIVTCFPIMILKVVDEKITYPILYLLASVVSYTSGVTNPIVYVVNSKTYRRAYLELFRYGANNDSTNNKNPRLAYSETEETFV